MANFCERNQTKHRYCITGKQPYLYDSDTVVWYYVYTCSKCQDVIEVRKGYLNNLCLAG